MRRIRNRPTETLQLRLASPSPVCIVCGQAIVRTLWAIVHASDGCDVLVHALRCADRWRELRLASERGSTAPIIGA
jgi:hypothetical protein